MNGLTYNGKEIKLAGSTAWNDAYGGIEAQLYMGMVKQALSIKAVDMYVFDNLEQGEDMKMTVRCAGYDLETDSELDEETVLITVDSIGIKTFWFKLDNQGDYYVGTFLFPSDY